MKKLTFIIAALSMTIACTTAIKEQANKRITPMSSGLDIRALQDCTIPAAFKASDFNWPGSSLQVTAFSEDLYDAVEVSQMQAGDTLVYEGKPIVVASVKEENGGVTVNNGYDEGGATLSPNGGGTYRATIWDDHSVYTELGKTSLMLADDFIFIDCGDNPSDPSDTIRTNQKAYLDNMPDYRKDNFSPLNTRIVIENGKVTQIERHWIP